MQPLRAIETSLLQNLLVQSDLVLEQPIAIQLSLAQDPHTPRSLLEVLVNQATAVVSESASFHVNWAGELAGDGRSEVNAIFQNAQLGQNDRLAVELLKLGAVPPEFLSKWVPAHYLIQALKNPYVLLRDRLKFLERLAQDATLEPRLEVAESSEVPLAVLERLVGDLELSVRLAAKHNPCCPPALVQLVEGQQAIAADWGAGAEELDILGQSAWAWIRLTVAQNPSTGTETLMRLATDSVFKVQLAVAQNPSADAAVLVVLIENPEAEIQKAIAAHENATEAILLELFSTQQGTILGRKNLPASILQRLYEEAIGKPDPVKEVQRNRSHFFQQPNTPVTVLKFLSEYDLEAMRADIVGFNPRITPNDLQRAINSRTNYLVEVVQHPNVSTQILERLAQCPNPTVRSAVTQCYSNGLKSQVGKLSEDSPALSTVLKKHRQALDDEQRQEAHKAISLLASRPDSPYTLTRALKKGDHNAKITVARNPKTPIAILEQLAQDTSEKVRQAVLSNRNLSERTLARLSHDPSDGVRCSIAIISHTPASILERLSNDSYEMVKVNVAGNPNTSSHTLRKLALDPSSKVQTTALCNENVPIDSLFEEVNRNPQNAEMLLRGGGPGGRNRMLHIPAELLEQLASRPENSIRYLIANHPNTSASTLEKLAFDSYDLVRRTVAENLNTPIALLVEMASQEVLKTTTGCYHTVSRKIATRKDATAEALDIIIRQPVPPIQQVAAANPNISTSSLEWLINHTTDLNVLSAVIRSSKMTAELFAHLSAHPNPEVLQRLVSQPNCPNSVLEEISLRELFSSSDPIAINSRIAANPNTSVSTLQRLCSSSHATIRAAIAINPSTPLSLLEDLAQDEKVEVRRAVTQNANASDSIRERLRDLTISSSDRQTSSTLCSLPRLYNPQSDDLPTILAEYIHSDNAFVRLVALLHPLMPVEILEQGARSQSWLERYAVAENPATPSDIRQQLALDGNRIIRAVATNHQPQ